MNFCTHSFVLIFLPIFFMVYFYTYRFKGLKASKYALLLFSFCFYLFSSVPAFFILLFECIVTYLIAGMSRRHNSKWALGMLISLQVPISEGSWLQYRVGEAEGTVLKIDKVVIKNKNNY